MMRNRRFSINHTSQFFLFFHSPTRSFQHLQMEFALESVSVSRFITTIISFCYEMDEHKHKKINKPTNLIRLRFAQ